MNLFSRLYIRPAKGELIETAVRPAPEDRCAVCGTVRDEGDAPVPDALVLLFDAGEEPPRLLSGCFTQANGSFAFGPLEPGRLHLLQVSVGRGCPRRLDPIPEPPAPDGKGSCSPV